jgi:hypothetical protein
MTPKTWCMTVRRVSCVALVACCGLALMAVPVPAATKPSTQPVVVMVAGNSEAGTLTLGSPLGQGPHGLVAQPGLTIVDKTILGCSISTAGEFVLPSGEIVPNRCGAAQVWQQSWTAAVAATHPDVVFVMAGDRDLYDVAGPDGTVVHPGEPTWTASYTADVEGLFRILGAGGTPVVAVKPPPCYGTSALTDADAGVQALLDPARAAAVTVAWQAAARATGARLVDLDRVVCPGGVADPAIRVDGVHFTAAGADQLAPTITRALRKAVTRACATARASSQGKCDSARKRAATSVVSS